MSILQVEQTEFLLLHVTLLRRISLTKSYESVVSEESSPL